MHNCTECNQRFPATISQCGVRGTWRAMRYQHRFSKCTARFESNSYTKWADRLMNDAIVATERCRTLTCVSKLVVVNYVCHLCRINIRIEVTFVIIVSMPSPSIHFDWVNGNFSSAASLHDYIYRYEKWMHFLLTKRKLTKKLKNEPIGSARLALLTRTDEKKTYARYI